MPQVITFSKAVKLKARPLDETRLLKEEIIPIREGYELSIDRILPESERGLIGIIPTVERSQPQGVGGFQGLYAPKDSFQIPSELRAQKKASQRKVIDEAVELVAAYTRQEKAKVKQEFGEIAAGLERLLPNAELSDKQFGAIASWVESVGLIEAERSPIIAFLRDGLMENAEKTLRSSIYTRSRVLSGMERRRAAEADLFSAKSEAEAAAEPVQQQPAQQQAAAPKEAKQQTPTKA